MPQMPAREKINKQSYLECNNFKTLEHLKLLIFDRK